MVAFMDPGIESLGVAEIFHVSRGHGGFMSHGHRVN